MEQASNVEKINCVKNYLSNEMQSLEFNLKKAYASLDERAIHDFRVSLKKLRAGFEFLRKSGVLSASKTSILLVIKPAFQSGGELRDLQVIHQLIKTYEQILDEHFVYFRSFITKKMLIAAEDFKIKSKSVLIHLDNTSWNEALRAVNINPDIRIAAKNVIGKTFRRAEKTLSKSDSDIHSYHKIRKLLKKARFVFEMNMVGDWDGMEYHAHLNKLKNLESLLGAWHDRISLMNRLSRFSESIPGTPEDYSTLRRQVDKDELEYLLSFDALFMNEFHWFYQLAYGIK
jgi:CHAD domain-containing protein